MRIRFFFIFIVGGCIWSTMVGARVKRGNMVDTLAMNVIVDKYTAMLNTLVMVTDSLQPDSNVRYTPYYFRLFAPGTLYNAPLKQEFGITWEPSLPGREKDVPALLDDKDAGQLILEEENRMLM